MAAGLLGVIVAPALLTLPSDDRPAGGRPHHRAATADGSPADPRSRAAAISIGPAFSITRDNRVSRRVRMSPLPPLSHRPLPALTGPATRRPAPPPAERSTATAPAAGGLDAAAVARAVFDAVNAARHDAGLAALTWNTGLQTSAHRHNLAMAQADELSHQLPGESSLGDRETAAGVTWSWAGENIAFTSDISKQAALGLESAMLNEQPPDDGHRQNILASNADALGVDVVIDTVHHRLWLTEDFADT